MIRTEIVCDWSEDPRARDPKARCYSLDNKTPGGEAVDFDTSAIQARNVAMLAGWKRKGLNRARSRYGWICPACQTREDA